MDDEVSQSATTQNQEQPEQKRSSVDKANDWYNKYQNARLAARAGRQIFIFGKNLGKAARAAPLVANPWFWIIVAVIFLIIIIILFFLQPIKEKPFPVPEEELKIDKLVDKEKASVGEEINYTLGVVYNKQNAVTVRDIIPDGTVAQSAFPRPDLIEKDSDGKILAYEWQFAAVDPRVSNDLNNRIYPKLGIRVKVIADNTTIINKAIATVTQSSTGTPITLPGGSANLAKLLPVDIITNEAIDSLQRGISDSLKNNYSGNIAIYQEAGSETDIPWEVLAGIHFREGINGSVTTGRPIGNNEPDVRGNGHCIYSTPHRGLPIVKSDGTCVFLSLLDSALYTANLLKAKISKNPENVADLVKALSRYNGGGNSNCGNTPYSGCPALYEGEDDTYVMNKLDVKHERMFIVYCGDFTVCNEPVQDARPGALSGIMGIARFYSQ